MRLFGYYALHSFVNQLRKLFKTWVLIFFVVCFVVGGAIGLGVALLEDAAEDGTEQTEETVAAEEERPALLERAGIESHELVELIAGAVILAVFVYEALSADKNGSKIFLPADVSLLFASPMQPQSVLMFRLATQLGAALAASIYLLFQLPNLMLNMGLSIWAALALIAVWVFTIMLGKLIQVLLYLISSNHPGFKEYLRRSVYVLLALLLLGYVLFWRRGGETPLAAAAHYLNAPGTRWIPAWGWLKGIAMYAVEGKPGAALLCLAGTLAAIAALFLIVRRTKADYYEDAMAKSEETAALLERARSEKTTGFAVAGKRKKDRGEGVRRDSMDHGWGANVFFYKSLYNRFRFAHFGVLTKTAETYLVLGAGVAALCRFVLQTESIVPVALAFSALAFFRSLGNPLEQDTKMDYFILIPEPMRAKLFWSLMGGIVNCLLDLLPGLLVAVILLGGGLPAALAWIPFILSIDFYATNVGAFIGVSVPTGAGKTIKQMVQIMFVYFGLLPDVAIMAVGIVFDHPAAAAIGAAALNVALGFVFFALSARFLEPKGGKSVIPEEAYYASVDLRAAKRRFSRLGLGAFVILLAATALQIAAALLLNTLWPEVLEQPWAVWVFNFAPLYVVAFPLGYLILRGAPAAPPVKRDLRTGDLIRVVLVSFCMMYAGNLVGSLLLSALNALVGTSNVNPVAQIATGDSMALQVLVMVILAPLFEEFIFRKTLIDRMRVYGEKLAVVTSALIFGLFHGNLSQFFYAAALGAVFGFIYLKTGKLRYTVGLHVFINFVGSVLGPAVLKLVDLDALEELDVTDLASLRALLTPGFIVYASYAGLLIALAVAGAVVLGVNSDRVRFDRAPLELPKRSRFSTVWLNAGMLLLVAGCIAMILLSLL